MSYRISLENRGDYKIVVVGCGGTGGFVAEGLCRLPETADYDILLVDYDRVEPHNLRRQNFYKEDVGKFKSQVLAERMAKNYGRAIAYSVLPYSRDLMTESFGGHARAVKAGIIIGCVDSPASRKLMTNTHWGDWWLDAGNDFHSGQVLIGNMITSEGISDCFDESSQKVHRLPAPNLQLPSLLIPVTKPERDCAQAIEEDGQSPVINQAMATLVLDFIYKLLRQELTWMGAYIDLEAGTLSTVPADPVTVARMMGVSVSSLMIKGCHVGNLSRRM